MEHSHHRPASARTRVLCVDDSPDMTYILKRLIGQNPDLECVGCVESADAMMQTMEQTDPRPDVVVLDATMPGREPIEAMAELAVRYPGTHTIVFSGHSDKRFVENARVAGAWGCVSKDDEPLAIIRAVRDVAAGHAVWPEQDASRER